MIKERASGVLLHVTSLPSKYGIGDLGPQAYRFIDFLVAGAQKYWQVLPLNCTTGGTGHSPYNCLSAFAGNPLLISPELLYRRGLLTKRHLNDVPRFSQTAVEYRKVAAWKKKLCETAFRRFRNMPRPSDYHRFCTENAFWLEDFADFVALRSHYRGRPWCDWPAQIRDRKKRALKAAEEELRDDIERQIFLQYTFYTQWQELRKYCNDRGIKVIGDIPIYATYDSPDVWAHVKIFKLDRSKRPRFQAGVPPDYFSRTGQLWGNPVYDWKVLKNSGYRWWIERLKQNLILFDMARIDHFRGFMAYWQVPAKHRTALRGKWVDGPKSHFFDVLLRHFPDAPIIAEDLGRITRDVREVIRKYDFPCMKILQFAFGGNPHDNTHILHNHIHNSVVYTGTHDNNTTRGWFETEASAQVKDRLFEYRGRNVPLRRIHWEFVRMAMGSVADLCVIPAQDLIGLPAEARMNRPACKKGNWLWRLRKGKLGAAAAKKLRHLTSIYARD
jgi:4-alpha-glucanotransferase